MRESQLHDRFANIVPESTFETRAMVIGAGMTGSWTALALARMVKSVVLYDFDTVEEHNVGVQAYHEGHIGMSKVEAVKNMAFGLPLEIRDRPFPDGYFDEHSAGPFFNPEHHIIVSCVDSIAARSNIAVAAIRHDIPYLIDTRVLGETCFVQAIERSGFQAYIDALPGDDVLIHAKCGAKGTAYAGLWVASQVCRLVNTINRGMPLPPPLVWHVGMNESMS